jgi:DNA-binding GntR family transcriptional regulator
VPTDGPDREARRGSLVDEAYREVRAAIVSGELKPGERLVVRPLEERLHLSPTPIKSALIALEREGFLTAVPRRGFFVTEITRADMAEIYEIREALEAMAARKAAESEQRHTLVARLQPLLEQQFERVAAGDLIGYSDLDLEFHRTIWTFAANRRLLSAVENLVAQVRFGSGTSSRMEGRLSRALDEHVAIIAAIKDGAAQIAADRSRRHVRLAGEAFAEFSARQDQQPQQKQKQQQD